LTLPVNLCVILFPAFPRFDFFHYFKHVHGPTAVDLKSARICFDYS